MDDLPVIVPNGTNELMCAVCFVVGGGERRDGGSSPAVGVCKVCRWYLCRDCTTAHQRHDKFKSHTIAFFYCARKLQVNRQMHATSFCLDCDQNLCTNCVVHHSGQVRATSFCLDCGQYLCTKCVVNHTGYHAYRRHTVIGDIDGSQREGLGHGWTSQTRDRRRLTTSSARRPNEQDGRKSPYSQPLTISKPYTPVGNATRPGLNQPSLLPGIPRQAKSRIDTARPATAAAAYSATLPRTLISSTVGKHDNKGDPTAGEDQSGKKSKSVHFAQSVRSTTATLQGEFSALAPKDKQPAKITAMAYLLNGTLVLADAANKNVKHFNKACKYDSCLHFDKLPIAICASGTGTGELYVSSGNEVHEIETENGMSILQTMTTRIPRIEGLTRWQLSGIAAIFRSTESKTDTKGYWEVHLISNEGKLKFIVAISTPQEVRLVSPVWYISSNDSADEMFISDTHNNRILRIDVINWRVINVIKGKETGGAPRSITSDAAGNALVMWFGEVRNISPDGEDLGVAVKDVGRGAVIAYNPVSDTLAVVADKRAEVNKFKTYQM